MSAHDQVRAMLDQLMGTGRDGALSEDHVPFTDSRVCRSFLLGCCPHEVLASTRMDMGDCIKIHDVALRADYEKHCKDKDYFFDLDALDQLERFFDECDRKTEHAKKRLAETQEELTSDAAEKANRVLEINEKIGKTLAEAERLGSEGEVDKSLALMEKVEEMKKEKQEAEAEYRNSMPASSYQQQKLRVCDICSAYLGIHDNDRRLADHFGGKLHMGFVFLRERLDELRANAADRRKLKLNVRQFEDFDYRTERRGGGGRYRDDRDRRSRSGRDRDEGNRERTRGRSSRSRSRSHRRHSSDDDDDDEYERRRRRRRSRDRDSRRSRDGDDSSRRSRDDKNGDREKKSGSRSSSPEDGEMP